MKNYCSYIQSINYKSAKKDQLIKCPVCDNKMKQLGETNIHECTNKKCEHLEYYRIEE